MSNLKDSPVLFALREAEKLAILEGAKEQQKREAIPPSSEWSIGSTRGAGQQQPTPPSAADALVGQLTDVNARIAAQIASVEQWLSVHPDLLHMLDASMREYYRQYEKRTNRAAVAINAIFCIIGTGIGLL